MNANKNVYEKVIQSEGSIGYIKRKNIQNVSNENRSQILHFLLFRDTRDMGANDRQSQTSTDTPQCKV